MFLYLFDGPQQPAVAVDHHQHRDPQAENEEADDVGVGLGRPQGPGHGAAGSRPLYAVAAPAQQRGHGPEERVEPSAPHSQQGLAVVYPLFVVHGEGAVAIVGEDYQRDQRDNP